MPSIRSKLASSSGYLYEDLFFCDASNGQVSADASYNLPLVIKRVRRHVSHATVKV